MDASDACYKSLFDTQTGSLYPPGLVNSPEQKFMKAEPDIPSELRAPGNLQFHRRELDDWDPLPLHQYLKEWEQPVVPNSHDWNQPAVLPNGDSCDTLSVSDDFNERDIFPPDHDSRVDRDAERDSHDLFSVQHIAEVETVEGEDEVEPIALGTHVSPHQRTDHARANALCPPGLNDKLWRGCYRSRDCTRARRADRALSHRDKADGTLRQEAIAHYDAYVARKAKRDGQASNDTDKGL